ncbi:hypothetical protein SO694_00002844 [Aureococcus anophagefferens]|uniref:Uncharacterized protein n=1 Tax=Aureococcus anophagefferens TaxID=44056 RepID=A0ABR1GD94_AURAN
MYAALGATEEDAAFASPNATTQPKKRLAAPSGVAGGVPAPARQRSRWSLDDMLADVEHVDRHHKGFEWLLEWDALRPLLAPMDGPARRPRPPRRRRPRLRQLGPRGPLRGRVRRRRGGRRPRRGDHRRHAAARRRLGRRRLGDGAAAPGAPFDLCLDKSSFDATLAENDQCGLLLCAFRSLRPAARHAVASPVPRDLLAPLFAPLFALDNFASVPRPALATAPAAEAVSVAAFRRRDLADAVLRRALRDAADATMDDYFKRAETALTPARVAEIRRNFAAPLPLDAAFGALHGRQP